VDDKEPITVEQFLAACYSCKLTALDLEDMSIGMCFDYIDAYIELKNPKKEKTRVASQDDFNNF
jgi:hypothetical protein